MPARTNTPARVDAMERSRAVSALRRANAREGVRYHHDAGLKSNRKHASIAAIRSARVPSNLRTRSAERRAVGTLVVHVPHCSMEVPPRFVADFLIDGSALAHELRLMTDHFTDELAGATRALGGATFVNRVSRLVMDPERFEDDRDEPMSRKGMGAIYTSRSDGSRLRRPDFSQTERHERVAELYRPCRARAAHGGDAGLVRCLLDSGHALIPAARPPLRGRESPAPVDLHWLRRFSPGRLPSRSMSCADSRERPGRALQRAVRWSLPTRYWSKDRRVRSLMIDVRRDLYMNEATGERSAAFPRIEALVRDLLAFAAERNRGSAG